MPSNLGQNNKELVVKPFDTLLNQKDYEAAEKLWSPNYVQHSAHIPSRRGWALQSRQEYRTNAEV